MTSESDTPPGPPPGEDNKQPRRRRGRRGGRGRRRPAGAGAPPDEAAGEEGDSTPETGMEGAREPQSAPVEADVAGQAGTAEESISPAAGKPPEPPRRHFPREQERRDRGPAPSQQRVERRPEVERQQQPWEPPADFRPASKGSIQGAIEEALHAIEAMRAALSDLEEIAELLEEVEVQQRADEREIDRLRSTIRSFQSQRGRDRDPRDARDPRDRDPRDREPGDRDPRGRESREARPAQETVFRAEEPARSEEESDGRSGPDES